MSKIVPIKNREVIPMLEELLAEARQGRIVAFGVACMLENGETMEGISRGWDKDSVRLYGAINVLRDMYFHDMIEHTAKAEMAP